MLAPRTDELLSLFREDEEAAFFDGPDELVAKAKLYLADPRRRQQVGGGWTRPDVYGDGHDADSRARQFLTDLGIMNQ